MLPYFVPNSPCLVCVARRLRFTLVPVTPAAAALGYEVTAVPSVPGPNMSIPLSPGTPVDNATVRQPMQPAIGFS